MWFKSYNSAALLFGSRRWAQSVSGSPGLLLQRRSLGNVLNKCDIGFRFMHKTTLNSTLKVDWTSLAQKQLFAQKNATTMAVRYLSTSNKKPTVSTPNLHKTGSIVSNNSFKRWYYQRSSHFSILEGNMLKALGFTAIFSGVCFFGMPYLFEYTPMKYFKTHPQQLVYAIAAINAAVFLLWKSPKHLAFMDKYFVLKNPISASFNYWQIIGSSFSHQEVWHLALNMLALLSFGTTLIQFLNPSNFLTLYMTSASISSLFSITLPYLFRHGLSYFGSLGASGALFGVMGCFSWIFPKAGISLFFFPIPGGAWVAFLLSIGVNAAGVILRWGRFDYAGHLGGSVAGLLGGWYYMESYRKQREERLRRFF